MRLITSFLCGTLILLFGCGSPPSTDTEAPILEQVRTIRLEENDSLFLGDFNSLTVTATRIYVPDHNTHRIAVYDLDGQIIRFFGSEGVGPGELRRPMKVVAAGDRVYVKESDRFSVFDTSGTFLRTFVLPEGVYTEDRWSLTYFRDHFHVAAFDVNQVSGSPDQAGPEQNTVAVLDSSFQLTDMMGRFPPFYLQGRYNSRWRHLDISNAGLMAVCYSLLPVVDVYDLEKPSRPHVRALQLQHPEFHLVDRELPVGTPVEELKESAVTTSRTSSVWWVRDSVLLASFSNKSPGFYDNIGDEAFVTYYAMIAAASGEQLGTLTLPGPILARDEGGRLYVRLSNVPDERRIGVYEVDLPQQ